MARFLTIGEAMGLLVADEIGDLEDVNHYTRYTAGAEMNVAIGTARLGFETYYVTKFGDDPIGRFIKKSMENENINTDNIYFSSEYVTGLMFKERVIKGDPIVVSFRKNSAATKIFKDDVKTINFSEFSNIHLSGIFLALSENTREISHYFAEEGKKSNALVTFDPNLRSMLWPSKDVMIKTINELAFKCDIVFPGISEGNILTGYQLPEDIANFYIEKGVKVVIIKLGEKGAYLKEKGYEGKYIDGFKVEKIIDTVGAGDGFAVGVITALAEGKTYEEAVKRGNAIGAMQLLSPSDNEGLPNREELERFMNSYCLCNYIER